MLNYLHYLLRASIFKSFPLKIKNNAQKQEQQVRDDSEDSAWS